MKDKIGQWIEVVDLNQAPVFKGEVFAVDIETYGYFQKPGDNPYCGKHGIAGVAVCDMLGTAAYFQLQHKILREDRIADFRVGLEEQEFVSYLNDLLKDKKVVLMHNCKFDLQFLLKAGVKFPPIFDTWIMQNIQSRGVFKSNKLKDIIREEFGIDTGTEEDKDKFLEENNTQDYGEVPTEIMGPYACDDVRYTMLLGFKQKKKASDSECILHDRYERFTEATIAAERRGIELDIPLLKTSFDKVLKRLKHHGDELKKLLTATEVDLDDDQAMMTLLHSKGLHGEPWDRYGESQFVFDRDTLAICAPSNPLAKHYFHYYQLKQFFRFFNPKNPEFADRFEFSDKLVMHPFFKLSIFSRGGVPLAVFPEFGNEIILANSIRKLFKAREGHKFVCLRAEDLPILLFLFFTGQKNWINAYYDSVDILDEVVALSKGKISREVASLIFRMRCKGTGFKPLIKWFYAAKIKFNEAQKGHYDLVNCFDRVFSTYKAFDQRLRQEAASAGEITDRGGRRLSIPKDETWKAYSTLIKSSIGSVFLRWADLFYRAGLKYGAHLVFANDYELVFETLQDNTEFTQACKDATHPDKLLRTEPSPIWNIEESSHWVKPGGPEQIDETWFSSIMKVER